MFDTIQNRILSCLLLVSLVAGSFTARADETSFLSAKPIWPKGRETEKNLFVGFRTIIEGPVVATCRLQVTASTMYRVSVNGQFLGYGPARGPVGWYRVDQWPLQNVMRPGKNVIAIEVAGYNCNSFYLLNQPSFLQAEVIDGPHVLASTAGAGEPFTATILTSRVQKVQRYSYQRPFSEVYQLTIDDERWKTDLSPSAAFAAVETTIMPTKTLLPRRVPYRLSRKRADPNSVAGTTILSHGVAQRLASNRFCGRILPARPE
jgi:alpha-L-rhamnosidase